MPPEPNPRLVFERLFGGGTPEERRKNMALRQQTSRSILDFVREDARSLASKLSSQDADKLDEYLTSVREIEQRIAKFGQSGSLPDADFVVPAKAPEQFEERMQVMFDMLGAGVSDRFNADRDADARARRQQSAVSGDRHFTRAPRPVASWRQAGKLGDDCADRQASHDVFRAVPGEIGSMRDADGNSILHNSMIVYASGNADGNAHSHTNLPVILAGSGGGKLQTGRFHKVASMPMSNMYLEMLEHLGIHGVRPIWRFR